MPLYTSRFGEKDEIKDRADITDQVNMVKCLYVCMDGCVCVFVFVFILVHA